MNKDLGPLIIKTAERHGLDPFVVQAIVNVESAGNQWAARIEPGWRHFFLVRDYADKLGITYATEETCQRMSWGLMQVMGAVAREYGFKGHLTELVQPELNLEIGCKHLKKFFVKYGLIEDAVSSYNQGGAYKTEGGNYKNYKYVDKVFAEYRILTKLK